MTFDSTAKQEPQTKIELGILKYFIWTKGLQSLAGIEEDHTYFFLDTHEKQKSYTEFDIFHTVNLEILRNKGGLEYSRFLFNLSREREMYNARHGIRQGSSGGQAHAARRKGIAYLSSENFSHFICRVSGIRPTVIDQHMANASFPQRIQKFFDFRNRPGKFPYYLGHLLRQWPSDKRFDLLIQFPHHRQSVNAKAEYLKK